MFSGIIQCTGTLVSIANNYEYCLIQVPFQKSELNIGDSVSCSGICLTIEEILEEKNTPLILKFSLLDTTLKITNIKLWKIKEIINLELAMDLKTKIGGHIVQGHVDATSKIMKITKQDQSAILKFSTPKELSPYIREKSSVSLNGISLTAYDVTKQYFFVSIIPVTMEKTNLKVQQVGDLVNLEVDIMAKYVVDTVMSMNITSIN